MNKMNHIISIFVLSVLLNPSVYADRELSPEELSISFAIALHFVDVELKQKEQDSDARPATPICIKIEKESVPLASIYKLREEGYPFLHASLFREWPDRSDPDYLAFDLHRHEGHINPPKLLIVSKITSSDKQKLTAQATIYRRPQDSVTYEVELKKIDSKWVVISTEVTLMTEGDRTRRSDQPMLRARFSENVQDDLNSLAG
jgi:hypothetical protein